MDIIIIGGIVVGLTQLFKQVFSIASRYVPLVSLILTFVLIGVYCITSDTAITWEAIQNGFIVALTSVGLYSSVKNTVNK